MEQIVVQVKDGSKTELLVELLRSLDFVQSVRFIAEEAAPPTDGTDDFFELAGMWEGQDIDLETLRAQAWPRQHDDTP